MAAPEAGSPASFFISYAREDQAFVRRLHTALTGRGRTVWVDWEAVPALADWLPEVTAAIEAADVFVFVISPESAASEVCATEIGVAAAAHKRFAPLTLNEVESALLPAAVRAPNWIFMRPSLDDFETGVASLVTAADTDFAWLRLHTRLQVRAREWEDAGRDESLLARGRDLEAATHWLAESTQRSEREVSALQVAYLEAAREREAAEAERTRELYARALARQLAAQAELVRDASVESVRTSVLLAAESVERWPSVEGDLALRRGLALLSRRPLQRVSHAGAYPVALSRDGTLLAVAERDRVSLIEPGSGRVIARRRTESEVRWLQADDAVLAADAGHRVYVWPSGGGRGRTYRCAGEPTLATVAGRHVLVALAGAIQVFAGRADPLTLEVDGEVTALALAAGGAALVATVNDGWKGSLRIWWLPAGEANEPIDLGGVVKAAAFSADGGALAALAVPTGPWMGPDRPYEDVKLLALWRAWQDGRLDTSELRHDGGIRRLAFSPGDEFLATVAESSTVYAWSVTNGRPRGRVSSSSRIGAFALSESGERLVTAHEDGTVRLTETATAAPVLAVEARPEAVALDPGGRLIVATRDETLTWGVETGAEVAKVEVGFPGALAFGPGALLLANGGNRVVVLAPDGTVTPLPHDVGAFGAAFAPGGVVTVANMRIGSSERGDHDLRVWDLATGTVTRRVARPEHTTFALNGGLIAEAVDGGVEIREIDSATTRQRLATAEPATALTFSPGGERLAVVSGDRVRVFDLATGAGGPERALGDAYVSAVDAGGRYLAVRGSMSGMLVDLDQPDRTLAPPNTNSVALDEGGRYAAFLSEDGRVEVRALPSEEVVAELAHDALGAAFSPDGAHIATAGRDGALRVWELAGGAEVARMDHPDKVFSPAFSADGRYLAAESADGWVWLWTWRPADVAAEARARAGRELSAGERARYLPEA